MRKNTKSNAREKATGFTNERGVLAQSLSDKGYSCDRIAVEVGVNRNTIEKWRKTGLIKLKAIVNKKKLIAKQKILVKKLIDEGLRKAEIAKKAKVSVSTVYTWTVEQRGKDNEKRSDV